MLDGRVVVPFLDIGRTDASVSFSNELVVCPNLQRVVRVGEKYEVSISYRTALVDGFLACFDRFVVIPLFKIDSLIRER